MARKRQSVSSTRAVGQSAWLGVTNKTTGTARASSMAPRLESIARTPSPKSTESSHASPLTANEAATIGDLCRSDDKPVPFWDEEPGSDAPENVPDTPLPLSSSQPDRPPHLDLERRVSHYKRPSISCTIVKLINLPRYATKDDVKVAVANELHADRFVTEEERARRIARRMTVGLVNFEIIMESRYSSAQNMGYAHVLLPYGYHGWRLQERGVTMDGQSVRVSPVTNYEPTISKRLFLQKTPYQDPSALTAQAERRRALAGDIRLRSVELGLLQKDTHRIFSPEWSRDFTEQQGTLSFDDNLSSFRISWSSHADQDRLSIVVRFTNVKNIFYGADFCQEYIVFHLLTSPAFESEPNVIRATDAQKRDLEDIRQRLSYLDDSHRSCAPYAFQLRITILDENGFTEFLKKRLAACLPSGEDLRRAPVLKQIKVETRDNYSFKIMERLLGWLNKVDFIPAFQLEALVRNVLVDPYTLLLLRHDVEKVINADYPLAIKGDILHQLAYLIRKVTPPGVLLSDLAKLKSLLDEAVQEKVRQMEKARAKQAKSSTNNDDLLPQIVDASAFLCHHVTVTPTAIRLEGPFPVLSNRVLRKYSEYQHCFLRVHFTDEEHHQFRWEREVDGRDFVRKRVGTILKEGFKLAGRHFDFLAYSFGALKEHTVWFVTPFEWHKSDLGKKFYDSTGRPVTERITADSIRSSLGDFTKVLKSPSQYGARLSQAFSATYPSIRMAQDEIRYIEDIKDNQDGTRCMSDGCAPMSSQLADDIDAVLMQGLTRTDGVPAPRAYQIRIGGSKGMIYVNPTLEGRVLCLRESMVKFDAPHSLDVEVSNIPRASAMYLNRPLVMVLEDLGVRLSTFLQLQQDTMDATLQAAKSIERFRVMMADLKLGGRFQVHYVLGNLKDMGFGFQDDCAPDGSDNMGILLGDYFFHNLVRCAVWDVFRKIKYQARIRVPDSWTVVGVLDEHGILTHSEVMVYIQDSEYPNGYFLKGPILICRSPVVHPGDVQMVTAIVPPPGSALDKERLPNCVVFSAIGARSVASALGGGDLDGDLFHVSEYKDIHVRNPFRPAEYLPGEKRTIDRDSTIDDVADFVVEFMNSDVLGLVSTTHLIIADQHPDGVRAGKCMRLAELHSNAVDYAKTGIPVPQFRIPHFEFPAKPDWKADEVGDPQSAEYYQSQRALGHLFRRVKLSADDPVQPLAKNDSGPIDDIDKFPAPCKTVQAVEDSITYAVRGRIEAYVEDLDEASPNIQEMFAKIFTQYVYELRRICTLHALHVNTPLTEMEVMLGTILRKSAQPKRRKELSARMQVHTGQLVGAVMGQLMPTGEDYVLALCKAWQAWLYISQLPTISISGSESLRTEKPFGAKSFGFIVLAAIFKILDKLDDRPPGADEVLPNTMDDFNMDY